MPSLDQICRDDFAGLGPRQPPASFQWYHLTLTTYGVWLPGDERGFRTYNHREHIDGDYRNPPVAGAHAVRKSIAADHLTRPPVTLGPMQREIVGRALIERFRELGAFVLTCAVTARHLHCELKMPYAKRHAWVGVGKRHTWFEMRGHGWEGKLFGRRKKLLPIRTRSHEINAFDYIVRHIDQGAWVWVWEGVSDRRLLRAFEHRRSAAG